MTCSAKASPSTGSKARHTSSAASCEPRIFRSAARREGLHGGQCRPARRTQDLKVKVQPTLSESVAVGAALANAATGVINPVAGVVTYLAQKMLRTLSSVSLPSSTGSPENGTIPWCAASMVGRAGEERAGQGRNGRAR